MVLHSSFVQLLQKDEMKINAGRREGRHGFIRLSLALFICFFEQRKYQNTDRRGGG